MLENESKRKNMGLMPSTSKMAKTSCPTKRGMTLRGKKVNQKVKNVYHYYTKIQ
jgi:hypothetical protein